jgi:4-hydroxy-4-methyl-2-oxoglutarate aldolase
MKKAVLLLLCGAAMAWGQRTRPAQPYSKQYLTVRQHSAEEDSQILKQYEGLRVCDIVDALDVVGLQDVTVMDREIRPLWRDEQKFTHRIWGIAMTVRLVPAQETAPRFASHAEERAWEENWYNTKSAEFGPLVRPGTILVVDNQARDDGFCGSNMGLALFGQGVRGFVGNEVCRDNDELILTRVPVYQNNLRAPRGINPGRMWAESYNEPVAVGHVLVMPGDVIVADSDGVAVVPRGQAEQVAKIARWIFEDDETTRGKIYDKMGKPRDWTVNGHTEPPRAGKEPIKR